MTRIDRRPGAKRGSPEHRARVGLGLRRYHALQRAAARIAPWELTEVMRSGTVPAHRRGYLGAAVELGVALVNDQGGLDQLSAAKLALVKGVERCELPIAMLTARIAQSDTIDGDLVSKLTSLLNAQRAHLQALGLDRVEREALDLRTYLAKHEQAPAPDAQRTNGADPDPEPVHAGILATDGPK